MWHPSRPKILTFKYRLTQVGKKGNFLRIKSVFVFFFFSSESQKTPFCASVVLREGFTLL